MKRFKLLLIMALLAGVASIAHAQKTIPPEHAGKFIGKQGTVCGRVASTDFAARSKRQPTFLNLDKPYPNPVFRVLIWGVDKGKFKRPPETLYFGKEICVTGTIKDYQGHPEIVVKEPGQIKIR